MHCIVDVFTQAFSCLEFHYELFLIGGVITDQAEADEDTSIKNRALMAIGKNSGVH